jgi:hypothetical protein
MPNTIKVTSTPTNNTELLVSLMEFSPYGAMCQMFIIDALQKHAEAAAQADPAEITRKCNGMLNGDAWVATAKDIRDRMAAFYARAPRDPDDGDDSTDER